MSSRVDMILTEPAEFPLDSGLIYLNHAGVALFWVRPELRDHIALTQFGWHMAEPSGDFD